MPDNHDEFFIGYMPKAPSSYASHMRVWAIVFVLAGVLGALLAATSQRPLEDGYFEFGKLRKFEGHLTNLSVPMIAVKAGEKGGFQSPIKSYLLVGLFKHGISADILSMGDGAPIEFEGTFIHRRGLTMVEITDPASVKVSKSGGMGSQMPTTTNISLAGEIIDSKCFLGVMRPATGKVHRACAIRCISGGVPAAFLVRTEDGVESVMLLAGDHLKPLKFDLELVGVPVRIDGMYEVQDNVPILRPSRITRLVPRE